jgi:trans-aconitate methyltransferase
MLAFHLDGEIDVSSRRTGFIDNSVRWLQEHFELSNSSRVIDFGCGPGLYTSRIAPACIRPGSLVSVRKSSE